MTFIKRVKFKCLSFPTEHSGENKTRRADDQMGKCCGTRERASVCLRFVTGVVSNVHAPLFYITHGICIEIIPNSRQLCMVGIPLCADSGIPLFILRTRINFFRSKQVRIYLSCTNHLYTHNFVSRTDSVELILNNRLNGLIMFD